jgi:hypothetical protein
MVTARRRRRRLLDAYRFPGFRPVDDLHGMFGDPYARVVTLVRRSKKRRAGHAGISSPGDTIEGSGPFEISRAATCGYIWSSRCGASDAVCAAR